MREAFEAHWVESVQKRSSIFTRAHMTRWHDTGKYMAPGAEEGWQQWLACARALEPMVRDGERLQFVIDSVNTHQLRRSKKSWFMPKNTTQAWFEGYPTARDAIDAAISAALEEEKNANE